MDHTHWLNAAWAAVFVPLYLILYGVVVTPYLALLPEVTSNLKERVDLTTFQSLFMLVASILFALVGVFLKMWGWQIVIGGAAILIALFFLPAALFIREKPLVAAHNHAPLGFFQSVWLALRNRPFRRVIAATALYWFALNGMIALVPFWVVGYLGRGESDVTKMMGMFLVVNLVFFIVFNALSARLGKYVLMLATFAGTAVVMSLMVCVGLIPIGSDYLQTAVVVALFGAPVAGFMVLPFAILGDVVDYDERLTGRRREAIFFGVQGIFQKIMIGVSVFAFTIVPYIGSNGTVHLREDGWLVLSGRYASQSDTPVVQDSEDSPEQVPAGGIRVDAAPNALNAPWTLHGPDGFERKGMGDTVLKDLVPGVYSIAWGEVPGWEPPARMRPPTPRGLKAMAMLCALFSLAAFVAFLSYPLRERHGRALLVGESTP
jgi:MFS family permease